MHKVNLGVSPASIIKLFNVINEHKPRRAPKFFEVPHSRLTLLDKTARIKGPKLYNLIVDNANYLQLSSEGTEPNLERLYLNPFKNKINRYLIRIQNTGDHEWIDSNSALHS